MVGVVVVLLLVLLLLRLFLLVMIVIFTIIHLACPQQPRRVLPEGACPRPSWLKVFGGLPFRVSGFDYS